MDLEKELVLGIVNQLGHQVTVAERQRILENGTQSLAAFLAYAAGLEAADAGDYEAAAVHFRQQVRSVQAPPSLSTPAYLEPGDPSKLPRTP